MNNLVQESYLWMCRIHTDGPMSVQVYWHSHASTSIKHYPPSPYMVYPNPDTKSRWTQRLSQIREAGPGGDALQVTRRYSSGRCNLLSFVPRAADVLLYDKPQP